MEIIKEYVENLIQLCGVSGSAVPVVRHVALVLVTLLLAWLSGVLCKRIIMPLIHKLTARTTADWDDILFNARVLLTACRIVPALVIWQFLPMVFYQFHFVREVLERLTAVYITIMTVRLITVLITSFAQLETSHSSSVRQYIKTFCGVLKIVVIFIAVIVTVAIIFGKSLYLFWQVWELLRLC